MTLASIIQLIALCVQFSFLGVSTYGAFTDRVPEEDKNVCLIGNFVCMAIVLIMTFF